MKKLQDILDTLVTNTHNRSVKGDSFDRTLSDIEEAKQQLTQLIADIVGEPVEPSINGEKFKYGKKVTIDLSHNRDESLKFIQENGKAIIQHEQRQRAKSRGIDL